MMKFEVTRPIATKSAHVRTLLKLAAPLIINNLAIASIHFADAVMAGRLGAETLAAVAVGSSVWMLGFTLCMGILMAVSPIVSRLYGAGDFASIGRYVRQAFWLSQMLAVFIFVAAFLFVRPVLTFIGIDPGFRDMTIGYVQAIMFGMPAMGLFLVSRFTTEGIGETRPIMYASLLSLACNVFGNWVFMYGNLGFPAMGAVGCGLASAISIWMMAFALGLHVLRGRRYRPLAILARFSLPRWQEIRELLGLGLPIAVTITAESGLFSAVAILTGTISAQIAAAHQIAINFAATMFMIPLALSSATTVLVGQSLGAGDYATARLRGWIGIGTSGVFMLTSAVFLVLFRTEVVDLYTNDVSVRDIAIGMLFMAAIFQVADGMQIGAAAALRGYKDAKVPMVINTFAYWVLAFPLAYLAAVTFRAPPYYIWGGFVIGLTVAAAMLSLRYRSISNRYIA
ncbi:MAG: MATE family efflux transporter [Gammaproteobacteria bacterium]|nr:MATE family efflux transporter [Gammaproteobacteria bacterium]MDH4316543.1 MATE family efflux transporter [Gammaproteobacteria bacterium]MDH5215278.1 MATE family efflux transporter [Gammaproteobacteria bacterium]